MRVCLHRVFVGSALLAAALLLCWSGAWASLPGRAVYVNGKVHRIWLGGNIYHVAGQPRDPAAGDWVFVRAESPHNSGWCVSYKYMNASGLAIFDNKIFYSYTSHSSCQGTAMYAYVCYFDLTKNAWGTLKRLGSVRTDLDSEGAGAGAAITVFNNMLYVFTDSGTYTSGDGVNWTGYASLKPGGAYQPLDAVTYYPPDSDPRILIVYGSPDLVYGPANYYTKISAASWNGQIGSGSDFPSTLAVPYNGWAYGPVSLQVGTLGAVAGFAAGAKTPAIQLFIKTTTSSGPARIRKAEFTYSTAEPKGSWRLDSYTFSGGDSLSEVWTYPWYTVACDASHLSTQARQQTLVVHYRTDSGDHAFAGTSDFMVPINQATPSKSCGDWGGTSTDTGMPESEEDAATLRDYWSLYGIILGSPPFAPNDPIPSEVAGLSNVEYGQSQGTKVEHTQSWDKTTMFSAGLEVHAGLKHVFEVEDKADISYTHGLENEVSSSSSITTGFGQTLGTEGQSAEDLEELGRVGWAIFGVPKVMVQDFSLHAYDYNYLTGGGTALNQNVHVIEVQPTSINVKPVAFELEEPGGINDDVPGLLAGIEPFPRSTDLEGWYRRGWESLQMPWEVLFGDGSLGEPSINPLNFTTGATPYSYISEETEETKSEGETSTVEMSNETQISVGTKLKGFKVDLKAGYESTFMTRVTNTTSFGKELSFHIGMKSCSDPEGVKNLSVQPYYLTATDETAPWIPTAYADQRPWCVTWSVTGGEYNNGTKIGQSPPAAWAEGVVSESWLDDVLVRLPGQSSYSLEGGRLGWLTSDGWLERIPMNAFTFNPRKGVTVELNGYLWSSREAYGRWTRCRGVWTFTTDPSVKRDRVTLKLDFFRKLWDFEIQQADLSSVITPLSGDLQVILTVNDKYSLSSHLRHHVMTDWVWQGVPHDIGGAKLTAYEGWYDSASEKGSVSLQGLLPEAIGAFGDMSLEVNGQPVRAPFLDLPYLQEALESGRTIVYEKDGLYVEVDFAAGTWFATIEREAFHPRHRPIRGNAQIKVLVGGVPWGRFNVPVANYTSQLWLSD
ncbi:exported hypothetical protein [uncultured Desulfatiglans sp.]|nr:exported hypothetical protein [uncultured Desulfatiglans sp.]